MSEPRAESRAESRPEPRAPDLSAGALSIHIVGIGGAGMSAIATVLAAMGHRVSGTDLKESSFLDRLRAAGVDVRVGHEASHLGNADLVATSTAIPASNPEVAEASARGIPVLRRAEILAAIVATKKAVAVGGTHGKTTTSSMLALALVEASMHPSFIVGGELNEIGTGAVWDAAGDLLVVEADESDGTFIELPADAVLVTNVEPDHIEHYGSYAALREAFHRFVAQASGPRVVCVDDPHAGELAGQVGALGYGTDERADYRMLDITPSRGGIGFTLQTPSGERFDVSLPVPGRHNARNAAGAMAMALELGAPGAAVVRAFGRYGGVARRFELRGAAGGVTFVDEYSHLPSEVAAAIEAAREGEWGRLVCVFQPHRFSRTSTLWRDFEDAFVGADLLAITDVYSAGESPRPGVTGKLILNAVLDAHPFQRVAWLPHRSDLVAYLRAELRAGDLCLTMGAGDLTTLPDVLIDSLRERASR